jgi:eukaryotic-like serine/threonine-protein kinase
MTPNANPSAAAARSALPYWAVASGSALALVASGWLSALCLAAVALLLLGLSLLRPERGQRPVTTNASAARHRVGQYVLGEKLGEGGMGVVYRAEHVLQGRTVAIKLLPERHASPENIARFEREARLTAGLSHPNTIAVSDVGRTPDGLPYYAMECVEGCDLQALVEREGPLPAARVADLLAQLAGALSEVHAAGLIHRDVKPANVMLCERAGANDAVKLIDFGLSLALEERFSRTPGQLAGTPLYLPPEAITAPETQDPRSDLYSLGALGYFLLTGATPFEGRNLAELCGHHVHSAPLPPSKRRGAALPTELEALILACLAKSPGARPASAAALRAALLPLAECWTVEHARASESRQLRVLMRPESSAQELGFLPTLIAA